MDNTQDTIDIRELAKRVRSRKKLFFKAWAIAFVASCLWILPQPRYYQTFITLAPESESVSSGGSLSSLASTFGVNLGNMATSDAIYPQLYPDLLASPNFIVELFDTQVVSEDGEIRTDYYTYLSKMQEFSIWSWPVRTIGRAMRNILPKKNKLVAIEGEDGEKSGLLVLSEEQDAIVGMIQDKVSCSIDKKTDVLTISVEDQDRLICATMADSVRVKLQEFITEYRTQKARIDLEYYTKLTEEARAEYDEALHAYAEFADANFNLSLTSYKAQEEDLQNEMQLKYNTYTTLNTQMQMAKAKVQERTPAFTIIQGAIVPQKPAGPKRMLFVFAMMFLTTIGILIHIFKGDIKQQLTHLK